MCGTDHWNPIFRESWCETRGGGGTRVERWQVCVAQSPQPWPLERQAIPYFWTLRETKLMGQLTKNRKKRKRSIVKFKKESEKILTLRPRLLLTASLRVGNNISVFQFLVKFLKPTFHYRFIMFKIWKLMIRLILHSFHAWNVSVSLSKGFHTNIKSVTSVAPIQI